MKLNNIFDRFFPMKYNFYELLSEQALLTTSCASILKHWLQSKDHRKKEELLQCENNCDEVRLRLERDLVEAFTTPFDRQEIYAISVEMDKIVEFTKYTMEASEAFNVVVDTTILDTISALAEGTDILSEMIIMLEKEPLKTIEKISHIRELQNKIEDSYREGMRILLEGTDAMYTIRQREVYHHIKDAAVYLGYTVDIFHRIVVRLV